MSIWLYDEDVWWKATERLEQTATERLKERVAAGELDPKHLPAVDFSALRTEAAAILEQQAQHYELYQQRVKSSDSKWLKKVLTAGTSSDKLAALTVMIHTAPIYRLTALQQLMKLAAGGGPRESRQRVLVALRDAFLTVLLPPQRKLVFFKHRNLRLLAGLPSNPTPGTSGTKKMETIGEREQLLMLWYFEDLLKTAMVDFTQMLAGLVGDNVEHFKLTAMQISFDMLSGKPEAEQELLQIIVNKLGDQSKKVASKSVYLLGSLLYKHPNMKGPVALEVETLLMRKNINTRAQYYALIFMNQIPLTRGVDQQLAAHLISVYFALFRRYFAATPTATDNDISPEQRKKLLSALLTGVNRAFPYAPPATNWDAYGEQIESLYQLAQQPGFSKSLQAMMLIFQVVSAQRTSADRFYCVLYEKFFSPELLESTKKSALFFNLVFKSLKADVALPRVAALIKRLLQVSAYHQPSFMCGALFIVSELIKVHPQLFRFIWLPETPSDASSTASSDPAASPSTPTTASSESPTASNEPASTAAAAAATSTEAAAAITPRYDPRHFNPLEAGAEHSFFWEISTLANHYHPSVARFASQLLTAKPIVYAGDPLKDFTLTSFLDKFANRTPKQKVKPKGFSIMKTADANQTQVPPLFDKNFLALPESEVPETDQFFYKFFKEKQRREAQMAARKGRRNLDLENLGVLDSSDEDDDDYLGRFHEQDSSDSEGEVSGGVQASDDSDEDDGASRLSDEEDSSDAGAFDEDSSDAGAFDEDSSDVSDTGARVARQPEASDSDDSDGEYSYDDLDNISDDDESEDEAVRDPEQMMKFLATQSSSSDDEGASTAWMNKGGAASFASAEEFAQMLEDSAATGVDPNDPSQWVRKKDRVKQQRASQRSAKRGPPAKSSSSRPPTKSSSSRPVAGAKKFTGPGKKPSGGQKSPGKAPARGRSGPPHKKARR